MMRSRAPVLTTARNLITWGVIVLILFPLFWIISTALRPQTELFVRPPHLLPQHPTLANFVELITDTPFPIYFRNSFIVATGTTLLAVTVGLLGAYALARFRFPFHRMMARAILMTYLLPSVLLFLPLYLLMASLGLVNTHLALIIVYSTFALPFALWLLRSFIVAIPVEIELAAMIDGASRLGAFIDVVVPQAMPGIISTALFTFILSWNEYLYALVLTNSDTAKTLPPGVMAMLTSSYNIEWSLLMAASVLMSLPLLVGFAFLQRHLTMGFGAGALKG
jgi:multiple sugar transport system permease protein